MSRRSIPTHITLKAFGRAWWTEFHARAAAGLPVGFMAHLALGGSGWTMEAGSAPTERDIAALVAVKVGSPDFHAWAAHFQSRAIRLPSPSRIGVAWFPTRRPPWESFPLLAMALPRRVISRQYRERVKARKELVDVLVAADRLGEWDESNSKAIKSAKEQLVQDWFRLVIGNGVDPLTGRIVDVESLKEE